MIGLFEVHPRCIGPQITDSLLRELAEVPPKICEIFLAMLFCLIFTKTGFDKFSKISQQFLDKLMCLYNKALIKVEVICLIIDPTHSRHFACFLHQFLPFSFSNSSL